MKFNIGDEVIYRGRVARRTEDVILGERYRLDDLDDYIAADLLEAVERKFAPGTLVRHKAAGSYWLVGDRAPRNGHPWMTATDKRGDDTNGYIYVHGLEDDYEEVTPELKAKYPVGTLLRSRSGTYWLVAERDLGGISNEYGDVVGAPVAIRPDAWGCVPVTPRPRTKTISLYGPTGAFEKTVEVADLWNVYYHVYRNHGRWNAAIYRARLGSLDKYDFAGVE